MNPKLKIAYIPKKYCEFCKREVFQTTHTASSYFINWITKNKKIICYNCNNKENNYENTRQKMHLLY
jgi:hypothetical protein